MLKQILSLVGLELTPSNHLDKMISGLGGFVAIALISWLTHRLVGPHAVMPVLASMGASAVLLFAAPHGQLSQRWPLAMGHLVSGLAGVVSARLISNPILAGGVAVGVAITAMYYLRCIHPPGGATALTAVLGGESLRQIGFQYIVTPVLVNVAVMLIVGFVFNYPFRWRRYPAGLVHFRSTNGRLSRENWSHALQHIGSMADVNEDDLMELHALAVKHAANGVRSKRSRPAIETV